MQWLFKQFWRNSDGENPQPRQKERGAAAARETPQKGGRNGLKKMLDRGGKRACEQGGG
jgi:hypothetical protein